MNLKIGFKMLVAIGLLSIGQSYAESVGTTDGNETFTLDLGQQRQARPARPVSINIVDSMIVLAVDVSGTVDANEYEIQKAGIVSALRDPQLQQMLTQCNSRGIAMSYVEWSGSRSGPRVNQVAPWTRLQTPGDMNSFAYLIRGAGRSSTGDTDIAGALTAVRTMIDSSPFQSDRKIVALSSDGTQDFASSGVSAEDTLRRSRDQLASSGVTIHAIAIESSVPQGAQSIGVPFAPSAGKTSLADYYQRNLRTGTGSTVTSVENYSQYAEAIKRQLRLVLNACVS